MTNQPTEFTLRGYVQMIRRHVWLIVILGLVCGVAAFGYSKVKKPTYSATASLSVSDPNSALSLTGGSYFTGQTALQQASVASSQVTRPAVVAAVQRQLGPTVSNSSVSVSVDPNSYVINVNASSHSATQAAALANAFARADAQISTSEARASYQSQAVAIQKQLSHMKPGSAQAVIAQSTLARLENLAALASPVSVTTTANVPGSPSSPKTTLYTVAALLFGLLLGVAVATARDAFDRRLRQARDVTQVLSYPVVGYVRPEALGHAMTYSDNGAASLDEADIESFRILRQNISYLGPAASSPTVLVTSAVGGEGKSTVAACLAAATAEAGRRTLLVECDLRKPVLAKRLGIKDAPGLGDYLTGNAQPNEILQPVAGIAERVNGNAPALAVSQNGMPNLVCITAGTSVHQPAELLASERFQSFVAQVSEVYDTVILDTAPLLPVADTLAIIPSVSTLIVCVRLEKTTRDEARAAQSALDRLPQRSVGLVLTDVREGDGHYYGSYGPATPARAQAAV
jgi:Mrp family chromosome partitioning ATPase/capsular polysaccharide biosynthesis protein